MVGEVVGEVFGEVVGEVVGAAVVLSSGLCIFSDFNFAAVGSAALGYLLLNDSDGVLAAGGVRGVWVNGGNP